MTDIPPPAVTSMGSGDVAPYPARLEIAYPDRLNRVTTAFRLVLVIPIAIVAGILTGSGTVDSGSTTTTSAGITGGLFAATLLLILFRQRYPLVVRLRTRTYPLYHSHRSLFRAAHGQDYSFSQSNTRLSHSTWSTRTLSET